MQSDEGAHDPAPLQAENMEGSVKIKWHKFWVYRSKQHKAFPIRVPVYWDTEMELWLLTEQAMHMIEAYKKPRK